jgi:hypothetical protein
MRDYITSKWVGKVINTGSSPETMILTAGQLILALFTVIFAYGFVVTIFCFELIRKKICYDTELFGPAISLDSD